MKASKLLRVWYVAASCIIIWSLVCRWIFFFLKWYVWASNFAWFVFSRLRTGNVIFHYRYYNNKLQRTEGIMNSISVFFTLVSIPFLVTENGLQPMLPMMITYAYKNSCLGSYLDDKILSYYLPSIYLYMKSKLTDVERTWCMYHRF